MTPGAPTPSGGGATEPIDLVCGPRVVARGLLLRGSSRSVSGRKMGDLIPGGDGGDVAAGAELFAALYL